MTVEAWLEAACTDAERRGMPELRPLLESLARAMRALRDADEAFAHPAIRPPDDAGPEA